MRVDVLTLFPAAFTGPLDVSILRRAREAGLLDVQLHDIRDYALDRHRSVDDYPFGGGQGMVLRVDVLDNALQHVQALAESPGFVVYLTPQGRRLDDRLVRELATHPRLVLVCGRYEGVDERFVEQCVDLEVSAGDFVVTGGELPAMILIDAVARHVPGALGDEASAADESFAAGLLEHAQYTRPAEYRGWPVPAALLSGDHARIERWRQEQRVLRTASRRPDLLPGGASERPPVKVAGATIRTLRYPDDYDATLALWRAAGIAVRGFAEPVEFEKKLARDADLVLVAESRKRIVGAVVGGWDGRRGSVSQLAVDDRHRSGGLGAALLAEVEARLRLKGCRHASLHVDLAAAPTAMALYEAAGWSRRDLTVMTKDLA